MVQSLSYFCIVCQAEGYHNIETTLQITYFYLMLKSQVHPKIRDEFLVFPSVIKRSFCSKRVTCIKARNKNE